VFARPRPWTFTTGKSFKALVTPLPCWWYTRMCMPTMNGQPRRTFGVSTTRVRLRHRGDVTVGLSIWRRNAGPEHTKILVTNLPEMVTARQLGSIYLRRWWVALLMKALHGVVGLGQPQVTPQVERVERSVAVAIMAYLLLVKLQAKHIPADRPWSAFPKSIELSILGPSMA
jgi:hypothetical protein